MRYCKKLWYKQGMHSEFVNISTDFNKQINFVLFTSILLIVYACLFVALIPKITAVPLRKRIWKSIELSNKCVAYIYNSTRAVKLFFNCNMPLISNRSINQRCNVNLASFSLSCYSLIPLFY